MICLRKAVEDYLTVHRLLGFKLLHMGYNLHHFVSFMERQGASIVTVDLALRWAQQPQDVQPALWAARLGFVRSFARYWSAIDPRTEILLRWYRTGIYPGQRLFHLSTFMGHADPASTSWYLTVTDALFAEAGRRFERLVGSLNQEVSL